MIARCNRAYCLRAISAGKDEPRKEIGRRPFSTAARSRKQTRLLEVRAGQVGRQLGDEGSAAPLRRQAARIDGANSRWVEGGGVVTGKGVAIRLRQIGVGVTQIEGEHLPGQPKTDVPGIVIFVVDAARERRGAIEGIAGAEPLAAEFA